MRGVYSIPAIIEVCAMKRICTLYVRHNMDNPLLFPEVCLETK